MNPIWKARLAAGAGALLALVAGWFIANGAFALPAAAAAIGLAAMAVWMLRLPFDTIALGGLIAGYVVGNRGFAQFSLVPGLPLLPAEAGLALGLLYLAVRVAFGKRLPLGRDSLNTTVLLWIVVCSARIVTDVRTYGALAVRDFAMVYYALFFFVAQAQRVTPGAIAFLNRCLLGASVAVIPLFELWRRFPDFFLGILVIGGTPLIFLKGDLVATFMAVGVVLAYQRFERTRRALWLAPALLGTLGVLTSENRASLLGLLVATGWLAYGRRWGLLRLQLAGAAAAGLILFGGVVFGLVSPHDNAAYRLYERVASIADFSGQRAYASADVEFKGDNNQFRVVWWQTVARETLDGGPWFGLGFGHDLAAEFVRRYYPDTDQDFTTRSPHSILMTAFGRTGFAGLLALCAVLAVMVWRTARVMRQDDLTSHASDCWLVAWIILVSACFGVVLEGPMGAVVFWIALGLANTAEQSAAADAGAETIPDERGEGGTAPAGADHGHQPEPALPSARGSA